MALKVIDGYDHYNQRTDILTRRGFLQYSTQSTGGVPLSIVTPGRNGFGKCMEVDFQGPLYMTFGDRNATATMGMAVKWGSGAAATFELMDSVTGLVNVTVWFNPQNYAVQVYRGPFSGGSKVLLYAGPNNAWTGNVWNFVEIKATISGTVGAVEVRVNGETVALVSGVNTNYTNTASPPVTAGAWIDTLAYSNYFNVGGSGSSVLDDFYYCDTVASAGLHPCDTFLGDVRVATLFPVGNNVVQWTPLAGTNWQEVSEVVMDSDTTYNFSSTPGQEDTFNFGSLPATIATIFGVQVIGAYRKDDASARIIKQAIKSGATEVYGTDKSIPDAVYAYFTDIWVLNPDTTLNWTRTEVNAVKAGYNLVS